MARDIVERVFKDAVKGYPPVGRDRARNPGDLTGVFGMHEMELAARKVIIRMAECGGWRPFCRRDLGALTDDEHIGWECLLAGGWMEMAYPEGHFLPTRRFAEKVIV